MLFRSNPKEILQKISDLGSQYVWRYDLWKVVLCQSSQFHLKEVIVGKFQKFSLWALDLSDVKIGHQHTDYSFLAINFRDKGRNSDTWQVLQVCSTKPVQN